MAFIKKCVSTVMKCFVCGRPGIYKLKDNWFCQECPTSKNNEKNSLKSKDKLS